MSETPSIAKSVADAWTANTTRLKARSPSGRRTYAWASGWHPCHRAMDLDLLHPEDRTFGEDTLERFRQGDDFERSTVAHLMHAGELAQPAFQVVGGQERFEVKNAGGRVILVGKMEGELYYPETRQYVPFEIKGGQAVRGVSSLEDFAASPWTRQYPYQLLTYMHAKGREAGLFILWRPARPQFVEITMGSRERGMLEEFLRRADESTAVAAGERELHPFIEDAGECRRCSHFGKSCHPPIQYGEGLQRIDDEVLLSDAELVSRNEGLVKEFGRAKDRLKEATRGMEHVMLGDAFEIEGSWGKSTSFPIPKAIKDKYKVVNEKGSWSITITPLKSVED